MLTVGEAGPEDQESRFLRGAALSRLVTLWRAAEPTARVAGSSLGKMLEPAELQGNDNALSP